MLKEGIKYKIKKTNYVGVYIKNEMIFNVFLRINRDNQVLGVDFFNREIKVSEKGKYDGKLDEDSLDMSLEKLKRHKEIVSIELCESGYWNILGYILEIEKEFLMVQCIHENYCLNDGVAKIRISSITNLCYGYEMEQKIKKLGFEDIENLHFCFEEIYHKNPDVFALGIKEELDNNFIKIKTIDILGENDSITFLKKKSIFMVKYNTLYTRPYDGHSFQMKEDFKEFDSFKSILEVLNFCKETDKKVKVYVKRNEIIGNVKSVSQNFFKLNDRKCKLVDVEYISIE